MKIDTCSHRLALSHDYCIEVCNEIEMIRLIDVYRLQIAISTLKQIRPNKTTTIKDTLNVWKP